jgi:hypothetical protein
VIRIVPQAAIKNSASSKYHFAGTKGISLAGGYIEFKGLVEHGGSFDF